MAGIACQVVHMTSGAKRWVRVEDSLWKAANSDWQAPDGPLAHSHPHWSLPGGRSSPSPDDWVSSVSMALSCLGCGVAGCCDLGHVPRDWAHTRGQVYGRHCDGAHEKVS